MVLFWWLRLQCRLLAELPQQLRGRLPPMLGHILLDRAVLDLLDVTGTGGQIVHPLLLDPRDLPRRRPARTTLPRLPPDTEHNGETIGENRVVVLRQLCYRRMGRP